MAITKKELDEIKEKLRKGEITLAEFEKAKEEYYKGQKPKWDKELNF